MTGAIRVAVIGLGTHGRRFVRLATAGGIEIVGAADPARAGASLGDVAEVPSLVDVTVAAGFDELGLQRGDIDVLVLAHHDDLDAFFEHAERGVELGANVLSYLVASFDIEEYPDDVRQRLDAAAKANGVTILSSGSQDVSWGGLVVYASSQVRDIRSIRLALTLGIDGYPEEFVGGAGIGMSPEQFEREVAGNAEQFPSVVLPTLRVVARRLGFTPTTLARTILPIFREEPVRSVTFGRDLKPGEVIGTHDVIVISTEEGVDFVAEFDVLGLLPGVEDKWVIGFAADPDLELEQRISVPPDTVDAIVVHRVPDLLAAPAGLVSALDMPALQYRPRLVRP